MNKKCARCGKEFCVEGRLKSWQIYCSKECQKKMNSLKERKRVWYGNGGESK